MFAPKFIDKFSKPKVIVNITPFGEFKYVENEKIWICFSENSLPDSALEITFEVEKSSQDLSEKINLTNKFLQNIDSSEKRIYESIAANSTNRSIDDVKSVWFLSGICLEKDNKTWRIAFEPFSNVKTIYNHFLRFTLVENEIIWSNLEKIEKNYERNTTDQNRNGRRSGV